MKLKSIAALALTCAMLTSTASAWSSADFAGGAPSGIVADGESLLISDVFNKVVWKATGNKVEQAAGQISIPGLDGEPIGKYDDGTLDTALFMEPWAMTPFLEGYAITDAEANVVRFFDDTGVYTAAGSGKAGFKNGTGTLASFDNPTGLATDEEGNIYIADTGNGAIRMMTVDGKVSTLVSDLEEPTGLCWNRGVLYVAETGRSRILKVLDGKYTVVAGGGAIKNEDGYYEGAYVDGPIANARFDHPQGVAVGADGTIYVADTGNHAIRKITAGRVYTVAAADDNPGTIVQPRSILVKQDALLVTDVFSQNVLEISIAPVGYTDVLEKDWYADKVYEAADRGITGGTGNGEFSPNAPVTRAALVVMLSKVHLQADGSVVIDGEANFSDVDANTWYTKAVRWAADHSVVAGYDGKFDPNAAITREQLATILYSYAKNNGYDVSVGEDTNILSYTDALGISEWAFAPLQWACGAGIIGGFSDGSLQPKGQATRAQTVTMLLAAMEYFGI